eukprot:TRINITY_DN22685_c0_g1_i1.p1 TRINITY_DN22685_c0_g1~~TRINITY_DN22685_c0_g1_i1.p1  ORF type:complete len:439 (-),score=113.87 TRINITY_DN22685_c0_g1_i1:165-1481(-)
MSENVFARTCVFWLLFCGQAASWTIDGTFDASGVAVINVPAFGVVPGGTLAVDINTDYYQPSLPNTTVYLYDWFDQAECLSSPTPLMAVTFNQQLSYEWTFDFEGPVILVINNCLCSEFWCVRPDLSAVKVHAVFENPGNDLLGIYLRPTPGMYTGMFVVWLVLLALWVVHAVLQRSRATRLHWAVAIVAAVRIAAVLCGMAQWWTAARTGLLDPLLPYSSAQAVLETIFTCVMWTALVFLAADHDSTFRIQSCPGYYRIATGVLVGVVVAFQILYVVGLLMPETSLTVQGIIWGHIMLWALLVVWFCQIRRTHLDARYVEVTVTSQQEFQTSGVIQTSRITWATPDQRLTAYRNFFVFVPTFILLASIGLGIMQLVFLVNRLPDIWAEWLAEEIYYLIIWLLLCFVFRIRAAKAYAPLVGGSSGPSDIERKTIDSGL